MIQSMRRNYIIILISFGDGNWFRHFFKQFEGDMTEHPTCEKEIVGNLVFHLGQKDKIGRGAYLCYAVIE